MGTNCAPLLADLFLYSYEAEIIQTLIKSGKRHLANSFNFTFRYIDDVLSLNNSNFSDYINDIYPEELDIKETTDNSTSSSFLDCYWNLIMAIVSESKYMINVMISISTL